MTPTPSAGELYGQAMALLQGGQPAQAEVQFRRLLAIDPRAFAALHMLGIALAQQGRIPEALDMIGRALQVRPRDAGALVNYGNILNLAGRFEDAVAAYDRALGLAPDADTLINRGNALQGLNRREQALASYDQALALQPANLQAMFKRAVVLGELRYTDEALASYDRILAAAPNHAEALNNRGFLWWLKRQDYPKAIADLERALALAPDLPYLRGLVLHLKMYAADWTGYAAQKAAIADGLNQGRAVARPFMFQAVSDQPEQLQACARLYVRDQFPETPHPPGHDPALRGGSRKIRLGYLSGEFHNQATSVLMAGLYERHDRNRFEVIAIDNGGADDSALTARLKQAFDGWIEIGNLNTAQAIAEIRAAGIDILVNLNGYFGKLRMDVFAGRPAPLQVNYLGFPGTLGAPYMDYLIADEVVIPPDEHRFYDEKIVTLPGCYQVNDDKGRILADVPSRAEAGLPETGFVFCNFNQSYKLTPESFAGWMRILGRVGNSVLWLLEGPAPHAENIARHAQALNIAPERILFAPDRKQDQHLARLSLAGLFLDGLPYNAHTTGSDALWAGVPVLTRRGTAFPGRVGASLLYAAGLPELVTENQQDYEDLAVRLATQPQALAAIKAKLTHDCPLFDTDLFRRRIEAAYLRMWETWLAAEPTRAFKI